MSRGTYTVYKPQRPDSKQDSWRSCTCSVIIFAVICLLILLVSWPLKYKNADNGYADNENVEGHSAAYKDRNSDAEIIPVNRTDNQKTAKIINKMPLGTTEPETEYTTTAVHRTYKIVGSTTAFNKFEESTQASTISHPPLIVGETPETHTEREKIISETIKFSHTTSIEDVLETQTERVETLTTHKYIHSVGTGEDIVTTNSTEKHTSSSGSIHHLHGESNATTEPTEKHTSSSDSIHHLHGESNATTESTEKHTSSSGSIHYLHSESNATTEPTEKHTSSSGSIHHLHGESNATTEPTEKASTRTVLDLLKFHEIDSSQDMITTNSTENYTSPSGNIHHLHNESNVTEPTEKASTRTVLDLLKYHNIDSYQDINATISTEKYTSPSGIVHHFLKESNITTEPTEKAFSRSKYNNINSYQDIITTSTEKYNSSSGSIHHLHSESNITTEPTEKAYTRIVSDLKSTETVKNYQHSSTTPFTAFKTTTELYHTKFSPHQDIYEEETNVCDSITCKNIASKSLTFMKHDENICEDFYSHACGGISKDYLLERDPSADFLKRLKGAIENTGDSSSEYAVAFKNYFTSCMNYDFSIQKALDPAQIALRDVGFFCEKNTVFPPLTDLLTTLLKKNFPVLFDVKLDVDPNTKKLSLVILPVFPDLNYESLTRNKDNDKFFIDKTIFKKGDLNLTEAYLMYNNSQNDISLFMTEVREALENFHVFHGKMGKNLLSEVLIFLELTIIAAQRDFLPSAIKRRKEFQYNIVSYKSLPILQKSLDLVNWEELLTNLVGVPLPKDIHIQVYFMSYLTNVLNTLKTTDQREMHNSILALYTHHLYKQFILDQKKIGDRTSYCLKMSSKQMQDVSSALYLESFEKKKIHNLYKHAEDIFERLVNTLYPEFNKDWLSENKNEQFAKETIQGLKLLSVGDHLPWKNPQDLVRRLDEFSVNSTCFIENTNGLQARNRKLLYQQLGTDPMVPENLWSVLFSPFDTKLSVVKSLGKIVLPLGALSYHLDDPAFPKYVSMAELGYNIAKQINLYLELSSVRILKKNDGAQPDNQLLQIKSTNDESPMFVEINPSDLSTEIITNVAGAKLAYMAYKNYGSEILSNDLPVIWANKTTGQLYFLLLAQQFCTKRSVSDDLLGLFEGAQLPPMITMNSIAVNTDEFYDLNGCTGESTMTAAIKILLPSVSSTTEMDPMDFSDR